MFTIGFGVFVIAFLLIGMVFFITLWLYYDRRDKIFYDRQRLRHVHHCVKCGNLYATRNGSENTACPECGFENPSLRF